jgi:hypothetical protein
MSWQRSIQAAVKALKKEEQSLVKQLDHLRERMGELTGLAKGGRGAGPGRRGNRGNRLSEEGRRAISLAAKRRWAKYRAKKTK